MSTITQFPSGNTKYRIEFDYLARTFVVVTLVNSSNPTLNRVLEVGRDYRFLNPTMIEMLVDQSGFDIVRIHRQTGTDLVVDFRNGSVLTASDLTNAELQAIHIAEEGRDQTVDLAKEYADAAGNSAGNAKDSEDEARRIAESIKAAGLIGYITRRSFEKGFNVTTWNEALLWEEDGDYYRWDGTLPKNVPAGSTPESSGGIGLGAWVSVGDATLRTELNLITRYFSTATQLPGIRAKIGQRIITLGYYSAGDGGGAEYIVTSGVPNQDYSDAGSIAISDNSFAKLVQKPQFDLKQFGVKPSDASAAADNDVFIAQAIMRSRFGFCKITISDVVYHKKPLVFDYYNHMEGNTIGGDASYTPRFRKIDNTTSGIAPLAYPNVSDTVNYDVDAGIILKRQNAATDYCRGVVLKGFLLESMAKSAWAIYAPHAADFDIDIDSRGFNGGIRGNVNFLGRYSGRHVGLGENAVDPTLAIGLWFSHFSTILDCGNSVTFRNSFNGFNRAIQAEYFGNGILDRCTFENIKKPVVGAPTTFGISATNSWFSGQISCESSSTCIIRAGNNANFDITLSAVFHVTQDDIAEGIIHVLSGGRVNLRPSTILADLPDTKIINDNGGYLDIAANTRAANIVYSNHDTYRFKDRTIGFGQTAATTKTSFSSGEEITFSLLNGTPKANLSGGTIQFNSPGLIKITVQGRGITSGSLTFGINGASSESVSQGQQVSMVVGVTSGDILNLKAASSLTLGSAGGVRVLLEPVF